MTDTFKLDGTTYKVCLWGKSDPVSRCSLCAFYNSSLCGEVPDCWGKNTDTMYRYYIPIKHNKAEEQKAKEFRNSKKFEIEGITYIAVPCNQEDKCKACAFCVDCGAYKLPFCEATEREDKQNVCFVKETDYVDKYVAVQLVTPEIVKEEKKVKQQGCIYVIDDNNGKQVARSIARKAVTEVLSYIESWANHSKISRCMLSNIAGFYYQELKSYNKANLTRLLDRAPAGAFITLISTDNKVNLMNITIKKLSLEE